MKIVLLEMKVVDKFIDLQNRKTKEKPTRELIEERDEDPVIGHRVEVVATHFVVHVQNPDNDVQQLKGGHYC